KLFQQSGTCKSTIWCSTSGIVDQKVKPSKLGHGFVDQSARQRIVQKVTDDLQRFYSFGNFLDLICNLLQISSISTSDRNLGSILSELNGNGRTDSRATSSHQSHLAGEVVFARVRGHLAKV